MQLKCNRYVFSYISNRETVEDYIYRSDDLAKKTYGRDAFFSRLSQVLEFARFLGWDIPRFGGHLPQEIQDIPIEGVNHIFENQIKVLIDLAPATRVLLESGKYCAVKMLCGTTAAGDLTWKLHLLSDKDGCPYVVRNGKRFKVKTRGTHLVCQNEALPYDENYLIEIFGGQQGIWPVPFLPEFFSDQPIARLFSPEDGIIEVVKIEVDDPVVVFAKDIVPWYRALPMDMTKALTMDDDFSNEKPSPEAKYSYGPEERSADVDAIIPGWGTLEDGEQFDVDSEEQFEEDHPDEQFEEGPDEQFEEEGDSSKVSFSNITVAFSDAELSNYRQAENELSQSGISSKKEAEKLREDPKTQKKAEQWFENAVTRLRINANCSAKLGSVLGLINKHKDSQMLILQPRKKWAQQLVDCLNKKGINSQLYTKENSKMLSRQFYDGSLPVLVITQVLEDLFIDDLIIISVSAFNQSTWVDLLNPSHLAYSICIEQLGYEDYNYVPEHPSLDIINDTYSGPGLDVLKLKAVKTKSAPKPKFLIKVENGKDKKLSSYKKAVEFAKKAELEGKKCQIYAPDKGEAVYITGIGELN
jgi:hypothetical protein